MEGCYRKDGGKKRGLGRCREGRRGQWRETRWPAGKAPNLTQLEKRCPFPTRPPRRWRGYSWKGKVAPPLLPPCPHWTYSGSPSLSAQVRVLSHPRPSLLEVGTPQATTWTGACKGGSRCTCQVTLHLLRIVESAGHQASINGARERRVGVWGRHRLCVQDTCPALRNTSISGWDETRQRQGWGGPVLGPT